METIKITKAEYQNLLGYKKIVTDFEEDLYFLEAKRISDLVKSGNMKTYLAEEVMIK